MLAQQREAAFVMVKLGGLFPAALAVATGAVFAQGFLVFVILGMTCITVLAQFDAINISRMAGGAARCPVFSAQGVFGVGIVVEAAVFPLHGVMAGFAFFAKLPFVALVVVILFVAADAGARGVFVIVVFVAIDTFHVDVFAGQIESRGAVVKTGLFPVGLVVAICAFNAQRALVNIVFFMAGIALLRCFAEFFTRHMAFVAFQRLVFAAQDEIGLGMVKSLFVEFRYLCIAPLVLSMATITCLGLEPPMKTCLGPHVSPDIFVAGHAKP